MIKPLSPVSTYSIVGYDPENGDLGIAVQSRFLAAGSVVPWAQAGVGAMAVQSFPDPSYGPRGLAMMSQGFTAAETLSKLTELDADRGLRQVGVVDASGRSASYTGARCMGWAGQINGDNFAAQGNMLSGEETVSAMADTFQRAEGDLVDRLVKALDAAEQAGGDARGRQSAGLLVVRDKGGFLGLSDRYMDLRVDDHPDPIEELKRLVELQRTVHLWLEATRVGAEGDLAKAISIMEEARGREPENVNILYFLARNYLAAGRREEAIEIMTRVCRQQPGMRLFIGRDEAVSSVWSELGIDGKR